MLVVLDCVYTRICWLSLSMLWKLWKRSQRWNIFLQLSSVIFNLLYSEIPEGVNPAKRINYINDWINYYKSHDFLRSDSSNNHFSAVKSCCWLLFTLLINLQISRITDNKGSTDDSGFWVMKRRKMLNILGLGTCLFPHALRDVHRNEEKSCDSVSPGSLSGISAHLWTDNCAVALTVLLLRWHGLLLSQPYYLLHSYLLPGCCISAPGRLLSHYLRFTQREPAVTRQSKQALMWIWCYAYGVATLSLCCCSGGTGLACTQAPAMICGGIWHLSVCKWSSRLTFRGGAWSTLVGVRPLA